MQKLRMRAVRRHGLSMIEVLFALSILATVVLAIFGMFPAMAILNKDTMEGSTYLYSAQEKMDQLLTANQSISTSYTTDNPFGTLNGTRRWKGIADPYGSATMQMIEVDYIWVEQATGPNTTRARTISLYGMVRP